MGIKHRRVAKLALKQLLMPPTMGAAIRRITSEPVPDPTMIGTSPAMITATVVAFGRTRNTAPSRMASIESAWLPRPAARRATMRFSDAAA